MIHSSVFSIHSSFSTRSVRPRPPYSLFTVGGFWCKIERICRKGGWSYELYPLRAAHCRGEDLLRRMRRGRARAAARLPLHEPAHCPAEADGPAAARAQAGRAARKGYKCHICFIGPCLFDGDMINYTANGDICAVPVC